MELSCDSITHFSELEKDGGGRYQDFHIWQVSMFFILKYIQNFLHTDFIFDIYLL